MDPAYYTDAHGHGQTPPSCAAEDDRGSRARICRRARGTRFYAAAESCARRRELSTPSSRRSARDSIPTESAVRVWRRGAISGCCCSATSRVWTRSCAIDVARRRLAEHPPVSGTLSCTSSPPDHSTVSRTRRLIDLETQPSGVYVGVATVGRRSVGERPDPRRTHLKQALKPRSRRGHSRWRPGHLGLSAARSRIRCADRAGEPEPVRGRRLTSPRPFPNRRLPESCTPRESRPRRSSSRSRDGHSQGAPSCPRRTGQGR